MSEFKKMVSDATKEMMAASTPPPNLFDQFEVTLREFAEGLGEANPYVNATIKRGPLPQIRNLVTRPTSRRDVSSIMLTFYNEGSQLRVANDKVAFTATEALQAYLMNFLTKSQFPNTLAEYKTICENVTEGYLGVGATVRPSKQDVIVMVPSDQQLMLARAKPGDELTMLVDLYPEPGGVPYLVGTQYRYLTAGGFALNVVAHQPAGQQVQLRGTALEEGERQLPPT